MSETATYVMCVLAAAHIVGFGLLLREIWRGARLDRATERIAAHRIKHELRKMPYAE